MSHEELNAYHRALGRVIVLLLACHASLYLNFYVQKGLLLKRMKDRDVILGLIAITSAVTIITSALARIRVYNYRLFLALHVLFSVLLLPVLYFHVSHIRIYILETVAVFALLVSQRKVSQTQVDAKVSHVEGTDLVSVSIDLKKLLAKRTFLPGQHIYALFPQMKNPLRTNPFTLAQNPDGKHEAQLVIRKLSGTTALLDQLTKQPQPCSMIVEGPYGAAKYFPDLSDFENVLLVAGGVGATFTIPIYRHLLLSQNTGDRHSSKHNIRFVWAVKDEKEAQWGLQLLAKDDHDVPDDSMELYVTGRSNKGENPPAKVHTTAGEEIELDERQGLLADDTDTATTGDLIQVRKKHGRPSLSTIVDGFFSNAEDRKVAVFVCGPKGLGSSLRREVGRWVDGDRHIFWHNEEFGW